MKTATIFHDPARRYCYLSRVLRWRQVMGGARFAVATNDGETMTLDIRFVSPRGIRVRCRRAADGALRVSRLEGLEGVSIAPRDGLIVVRSESLELRVVRRPFHYGVFGLEGRKLLVEQIGDVTPTRLVSLPLGYSQDAAGGVAFHESFEVESNEHLERLAIETNRPAYASSRGYSVVLDHASADFELGSASPRTVSFRVAEGFLDYVVVFGGSDEEIRSRYAPIAGRTTSRRW